MITDSPSKRYLLALILQGSTVQVAEDAALLHQIDYGSIQFLCLLAETHLPPSPFYPKDKEHKPSQEFLESVGLQGEVPRFSQLSLAAFRLQTLPAAREVLEIGLLGGASYQELARILGQRRVRTTPETVERYAHLFWDVETCDRIQLRALLLLRSPDPARAERLAQLDDSRALGESNSGVILEPAQRGSGREKNYPSTAEALPLPHQIEGPSAADRRIAQDRRANGQRDLIRQLRRSTPHVQRAREEQALKRAHYTDPRLILSALPPSPLSVTISKAHMGLPLERIDMAKAIEVLEVLALHRLTEAMVSTHPEAALRAGSYAGTLRQLQAIRTAYGASTDSLHNQIRAMALRLSTSGIYGDPSDLTGGHHNLNPYSETDADALRETLGTSKRGKKPADEEGEAPKLPPAPKPRTPAPKPPPQPAPPRPKTPAPALADLQVSTSKLEAILDPSKWEDLFSPPSRK